MEKKKHTLEEIQNCIETLEALVEDSEQLVCLSKQEKKKLFTAAGKLQGLLLKRGKNVVKMKRLRKARV